MIHDKKKSLLKDTTYYTIANYISQGLGMVNSVAMRRFMGPTAMGIWSIIQVILGYCGYASFGTTKAMARDYPILRGKGAHEKADKLKDIVFTFSMTMSLIPATLILGYLAVKHQSIEHPLMVGLFFLSIFLFIQRFNDLLLNLLRSDKKFTILSQLIVINAVGGLAVTFLFVRSWNIYGLLLGTLLTTTGSIIFIYSQYPYHFKRYWNNQELLTELRLGIPLVAATFLGELLKSIDKWVITKYLGFYELGQYSLAIMASGYVFSLPNMFSHIWYPNLQQEYGKEGSIEGIKNYLLTPVHIFSILCPIMCGLAIYMISWIAVHFLPKFVPGLPAMKIYLIGTFFLLFSQFSYSFLITINRYLTNIPVVIVAIGINAALGVMLVKSGLGLPGVALSTVVSYFVYGIGMYAVALSYMHSPSLIFKNISKELLTVTYLFSAVFLCDHFVTIKNLELQTITKILLLLSASSPFLIALEKKTNILKHVYELLLHKEK